MATNGFCVNCGIHVLQCPIFSLLVIIIQRISFLTCTGSNNDWIENDTWKYSETFFHSITIACHWQKKKWIDKLVNKRAMFGESIINPPTLKQFGCNYNLYFYFGLLLDCSIYHRKYTWSRKLYFLIIAGQLSLVTEMNCFTLSELSF